MEYQKSSNLLGSTLNKTPRFITKKGVEVNDQSGKLMIDINQANK